MVFSAHDTHTHAHTRIHDKAHVVLKPLPSSYYDLIPANHSLSQDEIHHLHAHLYATHAR